MSLPKVETGIATRAVCAVHFAADCRGCPIIGVCTSHAPNIRGLSPALKMAALGQHADKIEKAAKVAIIYNRTKYRDALKKVTVGKDFY